MQDGLVCMCPNQCSCSVWYHISFALAVCITLHKALDTVITTLICLEYIRGYIIQHNLTSYSFRYTYKNVYVCGTLSSIEIWDGMTEKCEEQFVNYNCIDLQNWYHSYQTYIQYRKWNIKSRNEIRTSIIYCSNILVHHHIKQLLRAIKIMNPK